MTQQPAAASLELLLPIIAAHRREADKNRQLSGQVLDAVCDSGLLGMPIAPAHGGSKPTVCRRKRHTQQSAVANSIDDLVGQLPILVGLAAVRGDYGQ